MKNIFDHVFPGDFADASRDARGIETIFPVSTFSDFALRPLVLQRLRNRIARCAQVERSRFAKMLRRSKEDNMIASQAKKLKVGARVKWSDGSLGTVADKNWHAIQVNWDDGQACILQFNNNEPQWKNLEAA